MAEGERMLAGASTLVTLHLWRNAYRCAVEIDAEVVLMPVSACRQLNDLSDDMGTKVAILFYTDARDALLKALVD